MLLLRGVAQQTDHLKKHAELNASCLKSEIKGTGDKRYNKNVRPQHGVEAADGLVEPAIRREEMIHM